jgi:hypothetical protein
MHMRLSYNSEHVHLIDDRLTNFVVGLTKTSPNVRAPADGNYDVCASVTDSLRSGETRTLSCIGTGRYLVVQLMGTNFLSLCEVEVYSGICIYICLLFN